MKNWKSVICTQFDTIRTVLERIDRAGTRIGFVVDSNYVLRGVVSDGDIRRALLSGATLESEVSHAMNSKPIAMSVRARPSTRLLEARANGVDVLPITDENGVLVDVYFRSTNESHLKQGYRLVVMAGGLGTRLQPLTLERPKPMIEVGGKPIIETIIEFAVLQGLTDVVVSLGYLGEQIREHLGDGSRLGADISYVTEDMPLGTGGALSLLERESEVRNVVMNGDVLSRLSINDLIASHEASNCAMTITSRPHEITLPYGVIEQVDGRFSRIQEKPVFTFSVNAGIYVCDPVVVRLCQPSVPRNMPDLAHDVRSAGLGVNVFDHDDYWLDIGRFEELERANREWNGYGVDR